MIEIQVKSEDLVRWSRHIDNIPHQTPQAIANALNAMGDIALRNSVDFLAESTGLDAPDVRNAIIEMRATPQNLQWSMDASAITLVPAPNWQRPWETPGDQTFQQQQLLQIITSEDDTVCEICQEAAENSPYTVEDINALAAKWKDWQPPYPVVGPRTNLIHPNCRCATQPWASGRRLNVNFASLPQQPPVVLTAQQIAEIITAELGGILRAT